LTQELSFIFWIDLLRDVFIPFKNPTNSKYRISLTALKNRPNLTQTPTAQHRTSRTSGM